MTLNDITRLSYLMAAIVIKPELIVHKIRRFQFHGVPLPTWADALPVLIEETNRLRGDGWVVVGQLRIAAETMMGMADEHCQTVGRFLTQALEMYHGKEEKSE